MWKIMTKRTKNSPIHMEILDFPWGSFAQNSNLVNYIHIAALNPNDIASLTDAEKMVKVITSDLLHNAGLPTCSHPEQPRSLIHAKIQKATSTSKSSLFYGIAATLVSAILEKNISMIGEKTINTLSAYHKDQERKEIATKKKLAVDFFSQTYLSINEKYQINKFTNQVAFLFVVTITQFILCDIISTLQKQKYRSLTSRINKPNIEVPQEAVITISLKLLGYFCANFNPDELPL